MKNFQNFLQKHFPRIYPRLKLFLTRYKALAAFAGVIIVFCFLFVAIQLVLAPHQRVTTYTLPYKQSFIDVTLRNWFTSSGVWDIRTGTLVQTTGGETPNYLTIPMKVPDNISYHASVYITLKKDTKAAGLTFNAQYPDLTGKQQRVYLFHPDASTLQLIAGYMDTTGSFVSQVIVPLDNNTTQFRLDVYVYSDTYQVQLNGQSLIKERPLFYKNGMVGFYCIASAAFNSFDLIASDLPSSGDQVYTSDFDQNPGGAGWLPFSGTWKIANQKMTQTDPTVADAGMGYETSTFSNYLLNVNFSLLTGEGAGVLFNMPSPYQLNGAQVVRYSDQTDALIWGYYDAKGGFFRQGFTNTVVPGTSQHSLKIYSRDTSYDIYLDNQLMSSNIPLQNNRGSVGLITSNATAGFSLVEVFPLFGSDAGTPQVLTPVLSATPTPVRPTRSPTPKVTPTVVPTIPVAVGTAVHTAVSTGVGSAVRTATPTAASTVVTGDKNTYTSNFSGDINASGWKIIRGDWSFSNGSLVQTTQKGNDDAVVYASTMYTNYSVTVSLTHQSGYGAGVLFNMPYSDRLNGAELVRYSDIRPGGLFWGHFDMTGLFVGDGYATVAAPDVDKHTFRIVSNSATFDIYLDDKLIAKGVASQQKLGYVGLLVSNASVAYDQVVIAGTTAVVANNSTNVLDAFSNAKILGGQWNTNGDVITQSVTTIGEYILTSGTYASDYSIEATITLPNGGQTGGGFILNMPNQGSRKGAYIVRLVNGGESVMWGYYDDNSQFQGQGSVNITKANSYDLTVVVHSNTMDVLLNGQTLFKNLKLTTSQGWFGLLAHGGVVKFESIKVTVTNIPGANQ